MQVSELLAPGQTISRSLAQALLASKSDYADCRLEVMPDKGLAHQHVRIVGTGVIARIPKQSQLSLCPQDNLRYQAAAFRRVSRGGHAPKLIDILLPGPSLPRGALLVEEIIGTTPSLPADLGAISRAMASFHALPLPIEAERAPLRHSIDPLKDMLDEISQQAVFLDQACLSPISLREIRQGLQNLAQRCEAHARPPRRLISFDTHPGNFLITPNHVAILVDLEKARYSYPSFDLAHATLYTSTTWDTETYAELTHEHVLSAYTAWEDAMDAATAKATRGWHGPLRLAMWLWSITWCAKWRLLSQRKSAESATEDWSYELSSESLISHVRGRVDHYLSAEIVHQVWAECQTLEQEL
ncbi:aminoglycoside phosphotransferase family protein [Pusillimonas sp. ANT_WB101]|uniref:aminoglycoside phosphotransferase family protein n=1 Tax=Pusillimonas sp. ANT_WB101 TaxID=2597356 RepID=UPI0011F04BC3|nr:aminoglycoside phosphotransferase family protein [Pusillimonas sp. ANT_WB101]KAA0911023.1 aminoglycoside phosphotransferase family protein [Pusillimonas sp. ANT_WB101]